MPLAKCRPATWPSELLRPNVQVLIPWPAASRSGSPLAHCQAVVSCSFTSSILYPAKNREYRHHHRRQRAPTDSYRRPPCPSRTRVSIRTAARERIDQRRGTRRFWRRHWMCAAARDSGERISSVPCRTARTNGRGERMAQKSLGPMCASWLQQYDYFVEIGRLVNAPNSQCPKRQT